MDKSGTWPDFEPGYFREGEAAKFANVSRALLRKWRRLGIGPPYIRLGKRLVLYERKDLEAFLGRHRVAVERHDRLASCCAGTAPTKSAFVERAREISKEGGG